MAWSSVCLIYVTRFAIGKYFHCVTFICWIICWIVSIAQHVLSNEDGEWHREYQLNSDVDESENEQKDGTELLGEETITDDQRLQEVKDNVTDIGKCGAGQTLIKTETGAAKAIKDNEEADANVKLLESDPKRATRNLGDVVTDAKLIHQETKEGKFNTDVHMAISALLPKLAKCYRRVEGILHKKADDLTCIPETAKQLTSLYNEFNEIEEHYGKISGKKSKRSKRR